MNTNNRNAKKSIVRTVGRVFGIVAIGAMALTAMSTHAAVKPSVYNDINASLSSGQGAAHVVPAGFSIGINLGHFSGHYSGHSRGHNKSYRSQRRYNHSGHHQRRNFNGYRSGYRSGHNSLHGVRKPHSRYRHRNNNYSHGYANRHSRNGGQYYNRPYKRY